MSDRWAPLQQLLEAGVSQGVYTGAVALVGLKGELRWEGAAGRVSRDPGAAAVTPDTSLRPGLPDQTPGHGPGPDGPGGPGAARSGRLPGRSAAVRLAAAGQAAPDPGKPPHPPFRVAGLAPFLSGSSGRARPGPPYPAGTPGRGHPPGIRPGHRHALQRPGLHAPQGGGGGSQR